VSAAIGEEVPVIADREDLLVLAAPGAGRGAPACFLPDLATIEIDADYFGPLDPTTITPHLASDRARYAPVWGMVVHECAHARHSRWQAPPDASRGALGAAELLEESRIEAAHLARRPDDRHWLRAAVRTVVMAGMSATLTPDAPGGATGGVGGWSRADAGRAAGLVLARVEAGVLTDTETAPLTALIASRLGTDTLAELRAVWRSAHGVADDDTESMLALGRRWCELLGLHPDTPTPGPCPSTSRLTHPSGTRPDPTGTPIRGATDPPDPAAEDPADPLDGSASGPGGVPGSDPAARAVGEVLAAVEAAVAAEPVPLDPAETAAAARAVEASARESAARAARTVFGPEARPSAGPGRSVTAGTRAPSIAERAAARQIARALSTAATRDRVKITTSSVMPPGRLRMRGALAADAQRAAGAVPTARPFTRTSRRAVESPPLRLGIACDVSGSMVEFADPVASAAWILAHAARHARVDATTATLTFGRHVRPVTRPGQTPTEVTQFRAEDMYEAIDVAIDALDGALGLSLPGAARLLVIVSDGLFRPEPRTAAQRRADRLRASGCGLLWLAPTSPDVTPLRGATVQPLTDPATTARAIARAATTALRR
jgi:hypothetical protein